MRQRKLSLTLSGVALGATFLLYLTACQQDSSAPTQNTVLTATAIMSVSCSGCHQSDNTAIPNIENLTADDLYQSLLIYKTDADGSTVMHRLMRGYSDEDIRAISGYLGSDPK